MAGPGDLDVSIRISADGSQAIVNLRRTEDATRNLGGQASRTGDALRGMAAAAAGLASLGALTSSFVAVNTETGRLRASLETVTGSIENASAAWADLSDFAKQTPYDLAQAVEGFTKLKALGMDASIESMRSYGNTASAMGKSMMDMIEAVADASTGEFERLKEFGIKASAQGDQVKLTFQGVTTTIGNNAKEIEGYIKRIGDVQFAGAMDRQAQTLGGALSNVGDAWSELMTTLGDSGGVSLAMTALRSLSETIQGTSSFVRALHDEWTDSISGGLSINAGQYSQELNATIERITVLQNKVSAFKDLGFAGWIFGGLTDRLGDVKEMTAEIGRLQARRAELIELAVKDRAETRAAAEEKARLAAATHTLTASELELLGGMREATTAMLERVKALGAVSAATAGVVEASGAIGQALAATQSAKTFALPAYFEGVRESVKGTEPALKSLTAASGDYFTHVTQSLRIGNEQKAMSDRQKRSLQDLLPAIEAASARWGLHKDVIVSVMAQESQFNPDAYNKISKATGLMQILPGTARDIARETKLAYDDILNQPAANIMAGTYYLKKNLDKQKGDIERMARAYNAGPGAIDKSKAFRETNDYVKQVTGNLAELGSASHQATADTNQFANAQAGLAKTTQASAKATQASADSFTLYLAQQAGFGDQVAGLASGIDAYNASVQAQIPALKTALEWQSKIASGQALTDEEMTKAKGSAEALAAAEAALATEHARLATLDDELVASGAQRNRQLALSKDELNKIAASYGSNESAARQYRLQLDDIRQAFAAGNLTAEEHARALQDIRLEYQESQGPMAAYFAGLERDLQDGLQKVGVSAMDGFTSAIADGLVDGRFEFDDFVEDIKRSLARLAVNTIVVNIVGNLIGLNGAGALGQASGVLGTGGAVDLSTGTLSKLASLIGGNSFGANAAALLAKGAGMLGYQGAGGFGASIAGIAGTPNWAYGLGGIGGSLLGTMLFGGKGYSGIGSSVGSLGGSVGGAALSGALGIAIPGIGAILGGLLGGIAGGGLGSLFGGDKTPRQGSFATSFSGYGFEDNAKAKGAFGLNFGLDDRYSKNIDGSQFQDFYDGMAQVSNTLAQFYGTDLATKVQVKLRESLGDFKGYGPDAASAFQEIFQRIVDSASQAEGDVGEGMGRLMKVAIGALSGSTEDMANQIDAGMTKVKATIGLFDSDIGKLLGMGTGLYYADMEQAIAGLTGYVARFREGAETVPETIERIVTVVGTLKSAVEIAGQAIENLTGDELIRISQQFTDTMASMGMSLSDLSSLQATYFDKFFTAEEKALKQRDAALSGIEAWNRQLGLSGDAMIDSSAEFRRYVESLDLLDPAQQAAYLSAMNMIGSFVSLDEALAALKGTTDGVIGSVKDFVDSIKPDEIKQADALKEMVDLFARWGMQLPPTADALYALIQAGALNEKQIQALADKSDVLNLAWAALAAAQEAALKELQAAYDDAVAKAKEASQARIEALREESAARIEALRSAYDEQVKAATKAHQELIDGLNDKLVDVREALAIFQRVVESANDALRSLTEQTDGIDEARQRALAEARKALEDYKKTGKLPDNITDIIGGLGTVDPNDFASREDWLKAVEENKRIIEELKKIGVDGKSETERQIELIEAQIEQANEQHEALLESLRENLDAAIKAEQDNLDKLIKAEEDALKAQLAALQAEFEKAKEDLMIDTNKLVAEANARLKEILDAILAGQKPVQPLPKTGQSAALAIPGFAAGGHHAGGLRIVGEMGPELEYTGPSVIAPNNGIAGLFRHGNSDVADKLGRVAAGQKRQIEQTDALLTYIKRLDRRLERWDGEGLPADREDFLKALVELLGTENV